MPRAKPPVPPPATDTPPDFTPHIFEGAPDLQKSGLTRGDTQSQARKSTRSLPQGRGVTVNDPAESVLDRIRPEPHAADSDPVPFPVPYRRPALRGENACFHERSTDNAATDLLDGSEPETEVTETSVYKTWFQGRLIQALRGIGEPKTNWAYIFTGPCLSDPTTQNEILESCYSRDVGIAYPKALDIHIITDDIDEPSPGPLPPDTYLSRLSPDRINFFFVPERHNRIELYKAVSALGYSEHNLKIPAADWDGWCASVASRCWVRHPAAWRLSRPDQDLASWIKRDDSGSTRSVHSIVEDVALPLLVIFGQAGSVLTGDALARARHLLDYSDKIVAQNQKDNDGFKRGLRKPSGPSLANLPGLAPDLKRKLVRMVRRLKAPGGKPLGLILHGPTGSGKTFIAQKIAFESGRTMVEASITEWESGREYEQVLARMTECFTQARAVAPSVVFIDEIDGLSVRDPTNRNGGGYNQGIVNCFLELVDGQRSRGDVAIIGATNLIDVVDPAVRRYGRLGFEYEIGLPELPQVVELVAFYFPHLDAGAVDALALKIGAGCAPPTIKALADEAAGFALDEKDNLIESGDQASANAIDATKPQARHIEQALAELETSLPSSKAKTSMGFRA